MRLQDVLKEREAEIALLEESLKGSDPPIAPPLLRIESGDGEFATPTEEYENKNGRSTPVSSPPDPSVNLSPKTMNHFKVIRSSLDSSGLIKSGEVLAPSLEQDNLLERLNELMRYDSFLFVHRPVVNMLTQLDGSQGIHS